MLYDYLDINAAGHLTICGVDAVDLAAEYGTPLYVMNEDRIRTNCRQYTGAMKEYLPAGSTPLYAGKALSFKGIYPIIDSEGMYADVVSPGEIYTAVAGGFPSKNLFFHGNNKTDDDIRFALEKQVGWFIVDNLNEARALDRIAGEFGIVQKVLLRVTVGLDPHTLEAIKTGKVDSQFGLPIETGQAEKFLMACLELSNLDVKGFHSHIGSQIFESDPFCDQIDILIRFAAEMRSQHGFTAEIFNLGGGFGVRYLESDPVVDIAGNIREIGDHLSQGCGAADFPVPVILMEPGRSIVADAGVTLYSAGGVKTIEGYRSYVTVDGGMTDNPRHALYGSQYTVVNASRASQPADFACTVAGRCCESGDRVSEEISIAEPGRGDIIAVLTTGAYNYSMASNYNRICRPAMVMIRGGSDADVRLAVRRQTYEDLVACEL